MIAALIGVGVFIIILGASMWNGRDLRQPLWRKWIAVAVALIAALLASGLALLSLALFTLAMLHPIIATAIIAFAGAITMIILYGIRVARREKQSLAEYFAWLNERRTAQATPQVTVAVPENPYVQIYGDWNVRKRADGTYSAVPLLPNGQIRWQAADQQRYIEGPDAWDRALELNAMHQQMKAIEA